MNPDHQDPPPESRGTLDPPTRRPRWLRWLRQTVGAPWFPAAVIAIYAAWCGIEVYANANSSDATRSFFESGDSSVYWDMANNIVEGHDPDLEVKLRPQRTPLYPLVLSVPAALFGDSVLALGFTNILIGIAGILALYFSVRLLLHDSVSAGFASVIFLANQFLRHEVTDRMMTEPLYVLWAILFITMFILYARTGKLNCLLAMAASGSLALLTRPGGLFMTAAGFGIAGLWECWQCCRTHRRQTRGGEDDPDPVDSNPVRPLLALAGKYAAAAALSVILTIPVWLPRWQIHRNPLDFGTLQNTMWAHSIEQARNPEGIKFTLQDYINTTTPARFVRRWLVGAYHTLFEFHKTGEKAILMLLTAAGVYVALRRGPPEYVPTVIFFAVTLLPVIWVYEAIPARRVVLGVMVPFQFHFAALAIHHFARRPAPAQPNP